MCDENRYVSQITLEELSAPMPIALKNDISEVIWTVGLLLGLSGLVVALAIAFFATTTAI